MSVEAFGTKEVEYYVETNTGVIERMKVMDEDIKVINVPSITERGTTITGFGSFNWVLMHCLAKAIEIHLPDTVTYIGKSAFSYDQFVTKLVMSNNVTLIGESAFESSRIKEIVWPEMCRVVPSFCFRNSKLEKFIGGRRLCTIRKGAFSNCYLSVADFSACELAEIPFDALCEASYVGKIIPPYYSECSKEKALCFGYHIKKDGTLTHEEAPAS